MINRTITPPIKDPVEFDIRLPSCERYTLQNGVEVYGVNMGTEDTLMVNWVFDAGNWYEEKKSVAPATNYLLKNGTTGRSAFDLHEHFDYYGAYLNRACYSETAELTLHCLNKHIADLLPVVAEMVTDSVFPEEELALYKQNTQQRLRVNLQKCEFVAGRLIDAQLFGENHPYGKYSQPEDYEAIQREDILDFYNRHYRSGRCVIFVAGKLPDNLLSLLDSHFGQLPWQSLRKGMATATHALQPAAEKKSRVTNDPNGVQAAIRIARPFPNRHHPDFQKVLLLNNVFGGFFGSRLMANIREEKGYTYGIYSYLVNQIRESAWMISTEVGREVSEAAIREIYKEMYLLREEPIDEEELLMTRNYMIGTILGDLDGPFQVAARWKNLVLNNLDEQYFYNGIQVIKTTSAEELQALAQQYLQTEAFYELVVV